MVDIQTANISVPGSNPASPKVENSEDRQGLGVQYCKITDLRGQKKGKIRLFVSTSSADVFKLLKNFKFSSELGV